MGSDNAIMGLVSVLGDEPTSIKSACKKCIETEGILRPRIAASKMGQASVR